MSTTTPEPGYFEVACSQRAHRNLKTDPVPEALIEKILEAGTHAPSAKNCQPWRFVVVQDPALRKQIGYLARKLGRPRRRPIAELTCRDRFGNAW